MSDPTYSFLPWLRSGVANSISQADGDASIMVRATIPVDLALSAAKLDGSAATQAVHRDVSLYGPGDIVGIDARAIVKVDPRDYITNFEPNYLAYVEFYDEDFPWRYTPAAADVGKNRLRPWIALVVLKETEFTEGKDISGKPLGYIELASGVDGGSVFPVPSELWAWAHVHANVDLSNQGDEAIAGVLDKLAHTIADNPDLAYSRLLCPRRLEPDTAYHAFVIPVFESGRLAGLGADIPGTTVATASSWDNHQAQFPYYHRWYFKTGDFGDFEYLVKLLQPRPVDSRVGVRDMDVVHPGANLPPIDTPASLGGVLKLGGALRAPFATLPPPDQAQVTQYDQWDLPYPHPFESAMADRINLADDYTRNAASVVNPDGDPDPVITSPLYGRWPALVKRVLKASDGTILPDDQNWIHRLNLDPRFRVAAGFGTVVIQANDQAYMAAAWQQVGDVLAANEKLRYAQFAMAASIGLYQRHIASLTAERQFLLTAPVHGRIMGSPTTVSALVRASVVPPVLTSGVYRRITRPSTALMNRLALAPTAPATIVTGVNAGQWLPVPPKLAPAGAIGIGDAVGAMIPANEPSWIAQLLAQYPWLRFLPWLILLIALLIAMGSGIVPLVIVAVLLGAPLMMLYKLLTQWAQADVAGASIHEEQQTPASVDALPTVSNFVITQPGTSFTPQPGATDSVEASNFKAGLRDVYTFTSVPFPVAPRPSLDLAALSSTVVKALDPRSTIPRRIKQLVYLPPWLLDNMVENFTPVMAYPVFDLPMYKPLNDLSTEYFLPNINLIPNNSLTLLETNQRFIEAYMVGLNHEMARKLLWNEYPTDQRGSYFRQFWDVSLQLPPNPTPAERETFRDIPELHKWSLHSSLGDHNLREQNGRPALLVLVVRGELLKRYPTAVIYAQKAQWQTRNGKVDTSEDRALATLSQAEEDSDHPPADKLRLPLFEAKVDPDIYLIGFDLTATEAKGGTQPTDDAGWFFVIKERPGEPRFGMQDVSQGSKPPLVKWNDLAWVDTNVAPGGLIRLNQTIALLPPVLPPPPDPQNQSDPADAQAHWNPSTDAAELAYMLYRVPVLVAVHASRMLPS